MKIIHMLILVSIVLLNGCSFVSKSIEPSHITPTAPTYLLEGSKQIQYEDYVLSYIGNEHDFETTRTILTHLNTNFIDQWNKQLAVDTTPITIPVDYLFLNYLSVLQTIESTYQTIHPDFVSHDYSLDNKNASLTLLGKFQIINDESINHALWIQSAKNELKNSSLNQLTLINEDQFHALIPANYQYYIYTVNHNPPSLNFQFNEPYSIKTIELTESNIKSITLISANAIALELITPYINKLTYDQLTLLLKSLNTICPIYKIVTLPLDTTLAVDIKYKDASYAYTWDKAIDYQVLPIR